MDRLILVVNADDTVTMQAEGRFFFLKPGPNSNNPADAAEIWCTATVPNIEHAGRMLAGEDVWPRLEKME